MYQGQGILDKVKENVLDRNSSEGMNTEDYGNKTIIMPIDPNAIFTYWNISEKDIRKIRNKGDVRIILEVMQRGRLKQRISRTFDAQDSRTMNHYIKCLEPGKGYRVRSIIPEIKSERYSNRVYLPRNSVSKN